jgi:acyl dehydratase
MFGKPIVNSCFTLSLLAGMSVRETSQNTIANLGWENIKIPKPVFVGDTIYAETEVLDMRPSKSRPNSGIIKFKQTGFNQDNEIVMTYTRTSLAKCRGYDNGKLPQFGTPAPTDSQA